MISKGRSWRRRPSLAMETRLMHRRRKQGGKGATRPPPPPQVASWGGHRPPTFPIVYMLNFIAVLQYCRRFSSIVSTSRRRKSHFCCLKKFRPPPQVGTSSYAHVMQYITLHHYYSLCMHDCIVYSANTYNRTYKVTVMNIQSSQLPLSHKPGSPPYI